MGLKDVAPIYVTRKTAEGEIARYDMSIGMTLVALLIVWVNIIVWGLLGLVAAALYVGGLL